MFTLGKKVEKKENTVVIRNSEGEFELGLVSDEVAQKIYDLVVGGDVPTTLKVEEPTVVEEPKVTPKKESKKESKELTYDREKVEMVGSEYYSDACVNIRKTKKNPKDKNYMYVIYLTYRCMDKNKTKEERRETTKYVKENYYKHPLKFQYGCTFSGDYDLGQFHWAFPSKKVCDEYIATRKAYKESKENEESK